MSPETTALIFLSGEHPGPRVLEQLLPACSLLIAADGGWDTALSLGLRPAWLIGDLDSIRSPVPDDAGTRVLRHRSDKDWSDTELALDLAWEQGAGRTVLFGGGGGRIDHLLAIHALFRRERAPDRWYTGSDELIRVGSPGRFALGSGCRLSLFPLKNVSRAASRGLRWALDGLSWDSGQFGLSNEALADEIYIEPIEGSLLLVRQLAEGERICPLGSR